MNRQRQWMLLLGVSLMLALLPMTAGHSHADRNVPPWPSAVPDTQTIPRAPTLKPLPAGGLSRSIVPEGLADIISDPVLEMKALVLYKSGNADGVYNMIEAYLRILGIPFDAIDTGLSAPAGTVEESDLWDGVNCGHYQTIFITTSDVWSTYLDAVERSLIEAYARTFGVRQVTLYAYPNTVEYGLDFYNVAPLPMATTLTSGGQALFGYLRADVSIPLHLYDVYGYQATPASGADVTTLLQGPEGHTVLAVFRPGDGREHMVFTMSSYYPTIPPSNIHARLLPYGMINWATRGVFLGERRLYFAAQPDDVLGWGDCWNASTHSYIYDTCYRNEPDDLDNLVARVDAMKASVPNATGLRIELPFNAEEVFEGDPPEVDAGGLPLAGTLTARAVELQSEFTWLNHTYSHADLDAASATVCTAEIQQNNSAASTLGFTDYTHTTLLTGDYSGLGRTSPPTAPNPNLSSAAYPLGVRYMLVNASDPLFANPSPNTGIPHPLRAEILEVPRYANNIFYAASTPEQETDLYNWIYCPGYQANPDPANRCYDYDYIINSVTNQALGFLLDFSTNPTMFHMNNLDAYDAAGHTLMTDFIEALYDKYNTYYGANVPVLSLRTQDIGQQMWDRAAYNASSTRGELRCGGEITLHTTNAASIPVTGVYYGDSETYAGQPISIITMQANGTVVIPGAPASVAAPVEGLTASRAGDDVLLTWAATTHDTAGQPLIARAYRVYGYAGPAEDVPLSQFTLLAEVTAPSFTHSGAAVGPAIYTYVVTALGDNCWKRESAESQRLAKAVLTVEPGYNLLAMPLIAADTSIQAVLAAQLAGGASVDTGDRVLKFNPATQSYEQVAVYVDGTGTSYDGHWYDVIDFPQHLSPMQLALHDGFWVQRRAGDQCKITIFGRAATPDERMVAIAAGPYQVIGSGVLGPLTLGDSNLWESGASGGTSLDSGDRLLRFDAVMQSYDSIAVLIDGTGTGWDGTWADADPVTFPSPSAMILNPGQGYWFHNRTPTDPFYWSYPRP